MTSDHISGFASELVQMAQAMARVPQLEIRITDLEQALSREIDRTVDLEMLLRSSREWAAKMEQKAHDAEASRDDAELRFLECDDAKETLVRVLDGLGKDILGALQAVMPTVPTLKPVAPTTGVPVSAIAEDDCVSPGEAYQGVKSTYSVSDTQLDEPTSERHPTPLKIGEVWATSVIGAATNTGWHKMEPSYPFAPVADTGQSDVSSPDDTAEAREPVDPTSSDSAPIQHGEPKAEGEGEGPSASPLGGDSVPSQAWSASANPDTVKNFDDTGEGIGSDGVSVPSDPTPAAASMTTTPSPSVSSHGAEAEGSAPTLGSSPKDDLGNVEVSRASHYS